ncbi:MAG TPA: flagellar motor protein MotB [Azospirillaceae bacterium]|nr:flagellar motor protein MotB [Azospirillaceae bacterium]
MALPGEEQVIIIKKRRKKGGDAHHGGAWKVAYADFVTAMMAFFLLLWLLNVTTADQKKGIADYFAPVSVSRTTSGSGGMLGGQSITAPGASISSTAPLSPDVPVVGPPGFASDFNEENEDPSDPTYPKQKPGESKEEHYARLTKQVLQQQPDETAAEFQQRIKEGGLEKLLKEFDGKKQVSDQSIQQYLAEAEARAFQEIAQQIRQAIQSVPELQPLAENVQFDQTPDGLRIQIVDQSKQSMFPAGGTQMYPQARELLGLVAKAMTKLPNKVSLYGHTDSKPFPRGDLRDNWELSVDRANASRRALIAAGLPESRILTVVGKADREPLVTNDPNSPQNRRISIVLHREARAIAPVPDTAATTPVAPQVPPPAPPGPLRPR